MNYELSIQLLLVLRVLVLDQGDDVVHGLEGHDVVRAADHHPGQVVIIVIILRY